MPKAIKIHKPTHKFFTPSGTPAIAIGQLRGDTLYLNLFENGALIKKTWCVGSCAYHLTGYGKGVSQDDEHAQKNMESAWRFVFGADVTPPAWCEVHDTRLGES